MLIKVKVFPSSKKEEILKKSNDSFEIRVKEKPIHNKANKRIIELLADYFNVKEQNVRIIRGLKQRNKICEIKQ